MTIRLYPLSSARIDPIRGPRTLDGVILFSISIANSYDRHQWINTHWVMGPISVCAIMYATMPFPCQYVCSCCGTLLYTYIRAPFSLPRPLSYFKRVTFARMPPLQYIKKRRLTLGRNGLFFFSPALRIERGQKERKVGGCWFSSSFPENILCSQRRRRERKRKGEGKK